MSSDYILLFYYVTQCNLSPFTCGEETLPNKFYTRKIYISILTLDGAPMLYFGIVVIWILRWVFLLLYEKDARPFVSSPVASLLYKVWLYTTQDWIKEIELRSLYWVDLPGGQEASKKNQVRLRAYNWDQTSATVENTNNSLFNTFIEYLMFINSLYFCIYKM